MPLHAVANTFCGFQRSTVRVMTSESSIIPVLIGNHVRPPSVRLPGQVPGARVDDRAGRRDRRPRESTLRRSGWPSGVRRLQVRPRSSGAEHAGRSCPRRACRGWRARWRARAPTGPRCPGSMRERLAAVGALGDAAAGCRRLPSSRRAPTPRGSTTMSSRLYPRCGKPGLMRLPARAGVVGPVQQAVGGAEVDAPGIAGIGGQRAHVAAGRPDGDPRLRAARAARRGARKRAARTSAREAGSCRIKQPGRV